MFLRPLKLGLVIAVVFTSGWASAREYRLGLALGFGGTGMKKVAEVEGESKLVERSEAPGIFNFYVESLVSDSLGFGIEHSRGFRLGPFSSGLSFTGLTGRYYFFGGAPSLSPDVTSESTVLIRQLAWFLGGGTGVAQGRITRDADRVLNISGSGVYVGMKVGADVPWKLDMILRPEIIYNMTFFSSDDTAPSLTEFAIQCSILIPL